MEKNKNEENKNEGNKKEERPAGNPGLMLLAGAYLLYTGYQLCADVLAGTEGASWGFFAAGAAFLVIGGVILFRAGKSLIKKNQAKKAAAEEVQAADPEPAPETPKKMTIAERARLAENLDEKDEQMQEEE